ncbi:MAG: hypothetical protein O2827_03925 [Verrucomicrobia bacterium]|nr:hypothetical protein [Verrucomicrobiota bacterium]
MTEKDRFSSSTSGDVSSDFFTLPDFKEFAYLQKMIQNVIKFTSNIVYVTLKMQKILESCIQ